MSRLTHASVVAITFAAAAIATPSTSAAQSAPLTCQIGFLSDYASLGVGGCQIGGQVFGNFRLEQWASQAANPSLTPDKIRVTPVDYVDVNTGVRYVGVRFGDASYRFELPRNPLKPGPDNGSMGRTGHMYGYMNVHDIRFRVTTSEEDRVVGARIGYTGLYATGYSNMNLGFRTMRNNNGRFNRETYSFTKFRFFGRNARAPKAATHSIATSRPLDELEVRGMISDATPTRFEYGITMRTNRYGVVNRTTGVEYVEYSFALAPLAINALAQTMLDGANVMDGDLPTGFDGSTDEARAGGDFGTLATPEPATLGLVAAGLVILVGGSLRARRGSPAA